MILEEELIGGLQSLYTEAQSFFQENNNLVENLKHIKNHYGEKKLVAQGGMKNIYKCKDLRSDRDIALAELIDDSSPEDLNFFLREARINAYLQHPNIMPIYELGLNEKDKPFFTMKFIDGLNLGEILKEIKDGNQEIIEKYPFDRLLDIFEKCCEAIAYAHSKGLLHLDIKPENISVCNYGEVLLCDWGISDVCPELFENEDVDDKFLKLLPLIRNANEVRGTVPFMAPEQIDSSFGSLNPKTDIYALGGLLYTILTNELPIQEECQFKGMRTIVEGEITKPSILYPHKNIPASLEAICMKSLSHDQADRYDSVAEILKEIHRFQAGFATRAEDASLLKILTLFYQRNKQTAWTVIVAMALIVSLTIIGVIKISASEQQALIERDRALASEQKAVALLEKVKEEQSQKQRAQTEAGKKWLSSAKTNIYFKAYEKAAPKLERAYLLASHDEEIKNYYAYYLLSGLKYKKAKELFNEMSIEIEGFTDKEGIPQDAERMLKVYKAIFKEHGRLGSLYLRNCQKLNLPVTEKMKLLKEEIICSAKGNVYFDYMIKENEFRVSIKNSVTSYPGSLFLYPITHLDISNTLISREDFLPWSTLKSLDASNTNLKNLERAERMEELVLNHKMTRLRPLYFMRKLKKLDIRGVESFDENVLRYMPRLERLIIDEGQIKGEVRKKIKLTVAQN